MKTLTDLEETFGELAEKSQDSEEWAAKFRSMRDEAVELRQTLKIALYGAAYGRRG